MMELLLTRYSRFSLLLGFCLAWILGYYLWQGVKQLVSLIL